MDRKKQQLVSVIIPVFNREKKVVRCIESVLRQKNVSVEILIVDDGSTDATLRVCRAYEEMYDHIHVYHKENGGPSSARNYGLDHMRGEYVMFLDSDDELTEDAIEKLLNASVIYDADMVIGKYAEVYADGTRIPPEIPSKYLDRLVTERQFWEIAALDGVVVGVSVCCKLYKARVWYGLRFPENFRIHEDEWMLHRYVSKCNRIYMLDHLFYLLHLHESDEGVMYGKFEFKHLAGADARLDRIRYLIWKGYYDAALYNFGFGGRILLNGVKKLDDQKSKKEIERLYMEYKKLVPILKKYVDTKNKFRLALFDFDLKAYGKVRSFLRQHK
ncbi:MAG: glycosyltransferase [Eubacterium sp.]|nr:glycosyltransferase [Eubacterium sp.]